ncbi:hypothetical protein K9L16_00870 [Candidatus Pacearchaeota archaeon]|nr:hypothetical protein [Candidatus Pacearchaeota archaeon]
MNLKIYSRNLIIFLVILGIAILFFFPSPEENLFLYFGTALFFIIIIYVLSTNKS